MFKKVLLAAQFMLVAFLVKFLDADSGGSNSDSGGSDSDSGSSDGSSEALDSSISVGDSFADSSDSGDSSTSSQRKPKVPVNPQDLTNNFPPEDFSQIPRRH